MISAHLGGATVIVLTGLPPCFPVSEPYVVHAVCLLTAVPIRVGADAQRQARPGLNRGPRCIMTQMPAVVPHPGRVKNPPVSAAVYAAVP